MKIPAEKNESLSEAELLVKFDNEIADFFSEFVETTIRDHLSENELDMFKSTYFTVFQKLNTFTPQQMETATENPKILAKLLFGFLSKYLDGELQSKLVDYFKTTELYSRIEHGGPILGVWFNDNEDIKQSLDTENSNGGGSENELEQNPEEGAEIMQDTYDEILDRLRLADGGFSDNVFKKESLDGLKKLNEVKNKIKNEIDRIDLNKNPEVSYFVKVLYNLGVISSNYSLGDKIIEKEYVELYLNALKEDANYQAVFDKYDNTGENLRALLFSL